MFKKISEFLKEVKVEMKKVSWPNRKETVSSTTIVITVVIFLSVFIGICDFGLSEIFSVIIK